MTVIPEPDDEYNLQAAWERVCRSFAQTTKVDLTTAPKYTIEEVLEQIRAREAEDLERNAKYKDGKAVIDKTLAFVKVLGGIVAQGASMVFAPSSLCFNAIAYLIDTGAKYKRVFSSLAELFRKICDVLDRMQIYMRLPSDAVDVALRKILNEQLLCFVDICALSIKVLQSHKVLIALKVFAFSGDEGVSAQLARLATLGERESQMRATLGFESQKASEQRIIESAEGTKMLSTAVDRLLDSEQKRDAYTVENKTLHDLDIVLGKPGEGWRAHQATLRNLLNGRLVGTGDWLLEDPTYTPWTSVDQESCSILGIAGCEGCGKSFLVAHIINHLRTIHLNDNARLRPISIAYHFFGHDKETRSLIRALKILSWQIANADTVYRKALSSIDMTSTSNLQILWDRLFAKSYATDSSVFILLDGLEQLDKGEVGELLALLAKLHTASANWGNFQLHILLTGQEETMSWVRSHLGVKISVIDLTTKNAKDMKRFIESRMDRLDIFGGSSEQVSLMRHETLETLMRETQGDFVSAGLLLDEISTKQRPGEIRDILARSGHNREDIIGRKIDRLNATLSKEDIAELNELLTWVMFAARPLTLGELESVLFLKGREQSLKALSKVIIDQYSSLLRVEGKLNGASKEFDLQSRVLLVSDSVKYFLDAPVQGVAGMETKDRNEIETVNESEVRIMRRFLQSVCDASLFQRFGFEEFFQAKLSRSSVKIRVDIEGAHCKMLKACLEAVCSPNNPDAAFLLDYAIEFFPYHLEKIDLSSVHLQDKMSIGPYLVALFDDVEIIKRWWLTGYSSLTVVRQAWLYKDTYADLVMKWLQDSAVTKKLTGVQSRWVQRLISKSEPDADILEHVALHLAEEWLATTSSDLIAYFYFPPVYGCFTKIENRKNPNVRRPIRDPDSDSIETKQILATADWVQRLNHRESLEPQEIHSLASTLVAYEKYDDAIQQLELASSLMSEKWEVEWDLAKTYAMKKDYARAIRTLDATIGSVAGSDQTPQDSPAKRCLSLLKQDLASWYEVAGHEDHALAMYKDLLDEYPGEYEPLNRLFAIFHKSNNHEGALDFLHFLESSANHKTKLNRCIDAFLSLSSRDEYNNALFALASYTGILDIVLASYKMAIAAAETQHEEARKGETESRDLVMGDFLSTKAGLMYHHARHCYKYLGHRTENRIHAIQEWERILELEPEGYVFDLYSIRFRTECRLALVYYTEVQRHPDTGAPYLLKLEKLARVATSRDLADDVKRNGAQWLAHYHVLRGSREKAQDTLRPYLKADLALLSDNDPLNDWEGYIRLAGHLRAVGMWDATVAAWSLVTPYPDYVDNPGKLKGPMNIACSGGCETHWTYANDLYVCKTCPDVHYDKACADRLRAGTLPVELCSHDHELLHVPPYDSTAQARIGEGNVRVGEEVLSVKAWIERIGQEWGLELGA